MRHWKMATALSVLALFAGRAGLAHAEDKSVRVSGVQPVSTGSAMPMIAQPMPADPNAPCATDCAEECHDRGFWAYADWLYLRARTTTPYAGFITRINGLGIDPDSHQIIAVETRFDLDNGYRFGVGGRNSSGWEFSLHYTHFVTDGNSQIGNRNADTDNIHANLLDRNLAGSAGLNGAFAEGTVDEAIQGIHLDYYVLDLQVGRTFAFATDLEVGLFAGARYAEIDLDSTVVYFNREGAQVDQAVIVQNTGMQAWGLRAGSSGRWLLGNSGLSLWAESAVALLHARFDGRRLDAYTSQNDADEDGGATEIRIYEVGTNRIVPVLELRVAIEYGYRGFYASLGYEFNHWFNMQDHPDVLGYDDNLNGNSVYRMDGGHLSLDGWFARAGVRY